MILTVFEIAKDEGSIVLFRGYDENDSVVTFAADHRTSQEIIDAMEIDELVEVEIDRWQQVADPGDG